MKKFFLIVLLLLLVFVPPCYAQDAPTMDAPATETVKKETGNKNEIDETKEKINTQSHKGGTDTLEKNTNTSVFSSMWKFIAILIIVCILASIVLRLLKKSTITSLTDNPNLKVVTSLKIAPNKSLCIVVVHKEAFLLAVTEKDVSLISRIEDSAVIETLNLQAETGVTEQKSFAHILSDMFTGKTKAAKTPQPHTEQPKHTAQAEVETTDFLASMRQRLNNASETGSTETTDNQG